MPKKIKLNVIILTLFLSFFISTAIAAPSTNIDVFRLTYGFYREDWPVIYKNKILWVAEGIIYVYDVETKATYPLFEGEQPLINLFGLVGYDGRYIVYNRYDGISYNVAAYDTENNENILVTDSVGSRWATDFDNKTIVYIDGDAIGDLYIYDLNNKRKTLIAHLAAVPRISGNYVVWYTGSSSGLYDIRTYNLVKNNYIDIPNPETANRSSPDVYGDEIIYNYSKNSLYSVRLFDINKKEERILVESPSYTMSWPAISKRYAVWGKNTAQHISGVEGIDLLTNQVFEIQEQGPHQNGNLTAYVVDNIAAWMAWRTGNGDIYGAILNKMEKE